LRQRTSGYGEANSDAVRDVVSLNSDDAAVYYKPDITAVPLSWRVGMLIAMYIGM
jgi:hypothetical protein